MSWAFYWKNKPFDFSFLYNYDRFSNEKKIDWENIAARMVWVPIFNVRIIQVFAFSILIVQNIFYNKHTF